MKLWHSTKHENIESIMQEGLKPNSSGIIYLSPTLSEAQSWAEKLGETLIGVETGELRLTAFEDCAEWEVLCWTDKPISPEYMRVL